MFKQIATQASALGLAALVTLATLGGMDMLAAGKAAQPQGVQAAAERVQQVVVVGQRAVRL